MNCVAQDSQMWRLGHFCAQAKRRGTGYLASAYFIESQAPAPRF
jgi:hypothetical protein